MSLGHLRLLLPILLLELVGSPLNLTQAKTPQKAAQSKKELPQKSPKTFQENLFDALAKRDWIQVVSLTDSKPKQAFYQLLRHRAFYELQKWQSILSEPEVKSRYYHGYDLYLKSIAAYQLKKYKDLISDQIDDHLPNSLREELYLMRARSLVKLKQKQKAKAAYRKFLKKFPNSGHRSDVSLELADIEWDLDNKYEALHLYEEIYTHHPLSDSENVAKKKLEEAGRLDDLDTDVHLARIHRLQQAAYYTRAIRELRDLIDNVSNSEKERVELAIAKLEFARKRYDRAEQLTRTAIKKANKDDEFKISWQALLALSLTRQGKYDRARKEYDKLLSMKIPDNMRERTLVRLGMMDLDDENYEDATHQFETLRSQFKHGNYQETAHWFGAWAIYHLYLKAKHGKDDKAKQAAAKSLKKAIRLLNKLPDLPEGEPLTAQAVYWKAQFENELGNKRAYQRDLHKLQRRWKASFHYILTSSDHFQFLNFDPLYLSPAVIRKAKLKFRVADPAFQRAAWKRLEEFASAHLYSWAELELKRFLDKTGMKNHGLRVAVANRLKQLGDWGDLVDYAYKHFEFSLEDLNPQNKVATYYYPESYQDAVLKMAKEFEVSPFLIWGVMREESRFQSDVVSSAGAVGLLQLMPSLGNRIGRHLRDSLRERKNLTEPSRNIRYGAYHLKELLNEVRSWGVPKEFVMPLVIASYNAGLGAVRGWMNDMKPERLDIFVESIPYAETRAYVKRVLQSANVYYLLYGEKLNKLTARGGSDL